MKDQLALLPGFNRNLRLALRPALASQLFQISLLMRQAQLDQQVQPRISKVWALNLSSRARTVQRRQMLAGKEIGD